MRLAIITLAVILPATAVAAPAPPSSWGKPGVALATYRAESIGCAMRAYYTDLSDTNAAKSFVDGSRQIETILDSGGDWMLKAAMVGHVEDNVQPERRIKELKAFQNSLLAKCLTDHGYHRFRLTEDQRKHLQSLKIGSDARHAYLHRLASDPTILSSQSEPDPPRP